MDEKVYQGYLYDFYGSLLKDSRREILSEYLMEDISLSEIAQDRGITRQAAFDMVRRSIKSLEDYEAKLGLLSKFLSAKNDIEKIEALASKSDITAEELKTISGLAAGILEDF